MTYLDDLHTAGKLTPCPTCGSMDALRPILLTSGPHHAAIVCDDCPDPWSKYGNQRFVRFAPAPTNLTARPKRSKASTNLLHTIRMGNEPLYCLICLRDERFLPPGVHMEAHHVIEHQDGGTDNPTNLQPLCNRCHEWVHWRRRDTGSGEQAGKAPQLPTAGPEVAHASR